MGAWQPRQQAVKSSDGVSDKLGFRSEAGQFWECSALERNAMQRKISGATKSWPVSRIMLTSCIGRSLAMLMLLPAAIGNASRRIAVSCPCEASRANNFLAGRSRAACFSWGDGLKVCPQLWTFCAQLRARSARTGNAVTVRAARGAKRRGFLWQLAGRGRFHPVSSVFDRRNETIAIRHRWRSRQ